MRVTSQLYPHAPLNLDEVKEILGDRYHKHGDYCFSKAQVERMSKFNQTVLDAIAIEEYGRRKK